MMRIGLTGNIGTGKSTIARIFEILKVPVYHADKQARILLESDRVTEQISRLFGITVINAQHQVDRKALAAIVFNDKTKLDTLNNLIHPLVEEDFMQWCVFHQSNNYIVHEAAILFESGFDRLFDANILVIAPEELCISRVMVRDGLTKDMVIARMNNQWSQEVKKEKAKYHVINDEKMMAIPQVLAIHRKIRSR
jgi:dephospho-CoA kinase